MGEKEKERGTKEMVCAKTTKDSGKKLRKKQTQERLKEGRGKRDEGLIKKGKAAKEQVGRRQGS